MIPVVLTVAHRLMARESAMSVGAQCRVRNTLLYDSAIRILSRKHTDYHNNERGLIVRYRHARHTAIDTVVTMSTQGYTNCS